MKTKFNFKKSFIIFLLFLVGNLWGQTETDVPVSGITSPVFGQYQFQGFGTACSGISSTIWGFCQSTHHAGNSGINGANDTYAWDCNLTGNADAGKNVYPVEDGWITNITGWGGGSYGQVLIKHITDGKTWYSGYLHLTNITSKKAINGSFVSKDEIIGKVGDVSPANLTEHLHFAIYYMNSSNKLISTSRNFDERNSLYSFENINQSLPIYAGSITTPKELKLVIEDPQFNFNINQISEIKIASSTGVVKNINNPTITVEQFSVSNPAGSQPSSKTWRLIKFTPTTSQLSGLTNGRGYEISFKLTQGSSVKIYQNSDVYFEDFYSSTSLQDLSDLDNWVSAPVRVGANMGLYRGPSPTQFNPSENLTRAQAAAVLVNLGARLRLLNVVTIGTQFGDVNSSHPFFEQIQTLRNYGHISANTNFNPDSFITVGEFCKMITNVLNIQSSDYAPTPYLNYLGRKIIVSSSNTELADAMNKLLKIVDITDTNGFWITNNAWDFFDFSSISQTSSFYTVSGTSYVSRAKMAKVLLNLANWKSSQTGVSLRTNNANFSSNNLSDGVSLGEKYDNASITATSTPVTPTQQTYSVNSGGSITILYNPGTLPQHYYWSMLKNGATLTSNNDQHSSVTFTAPTVSSPTQWKLYTYTANNKGKARETFITINVGGSVVSTIPVPTNLQINSYNNNSLYIEWDTVGFGITNYDVQYSQDPNFTYGLVSYNATSNSSSGYWEPTGLTSGTFYARVRSVNSNGGTSAWSNVVSYSLNANTQPFISVVTPTAGTTISGTSTTLNFQATGGNAPLSYTVYFSSWNPQGNPPVATNISTPSFTVSNLTPNNTYLWAVKVVDADGDEFITNNYSLNTSPSTTVPNGTISIENGATSTNSISVNLNITATAFNNGTIYGMRFSNDGITWPDTWEQYNLNRPAWSLVGYGGTSSPGIKTVYVQFKDNSNNISPIYSDNITLNAGAKGIFIVRDKTFESLRAANEYAVSGDIIYATAGYFDLTSEKGNVLYLPYNTTSIGGGLKSGVSLIGESAEKTTLFWDGTQTRGIGLAGNNTVQGITFIVSLNTNVSRATIMLHGASNVTIKNCVFKNSDYSIESYNFYGNTTANTNINIYNNLFINNNSRALYFINCNGLNVYNNTFNNNGFQTISLSDLSNVNFKNNIVSNNKAEAIAINNYSNLDFKNNNVFNNRFSAASAIENYVNFTGSLADQTGINGNISQNPLFINSASNNFVLNSNSPSVNTGVNVGLPFFGTAPEMGLYELGGSGSIVLNSNVSTTFLVTKPDGTQQTYLNGQTISNLPQGVYGIYPQAKVGYYSPVDSFVYLNINETKNYTGNYTLDTQGPEGYIHINGGVYSTQSPYVSIFCDVVDKINGLQNGQMQFSNDGINWTNPEPIKNKKLLWDLSNGNITNLIAGTKTIYTKFSDKNGYWSNIITDNIEYIPTGKIKIIEPNNNVSNLDFRNNILNAQLGDILLLKEGIHSIFGGGITINSGLTFQGLNKENSKIYQLSAINSNDGFKFDNLTLNAVSTQNFYAQDIPNSKKSIFSNNIFINESITNNGNNLIVANNIFKNISSNNYGFLMYYSNDVDSKFKVFNNVFDATINNSSLQTENGISINGMCCNNLFDIKNNIFVNFDVLTTGVYNGGPIKYTNSNPIIGDINIVNNNFFNCVNKIIKYDGTDISKDKFSYNINPNFNTNYSLPANSQLLNSGNTDLLFNDHNTSTNDIGITGGIYYNTPPSVTVTFEETGYNEFKFTANATDAQTPINSLQFRWDFNSDGIMDTPFLLSNEITRTISTTNDMITCYVFDELFAINFHKIQAPTASNVSLSITQPQIIGICAGSSSPFQTIATGNFNQGNEFKIIYSGPNADFTNPQFTQNITSQPNGIINISFPASLPTCTTCYIKLVSNNPVNSSISVLAAVYQAPSESVSATPSATTICPNTNVTFTATPTNGGTTPIYLWKRNGQVVGTNSNQYSASDITNNDLVWVEMVSNQTCTSTIPVISLPVSVNVTQIDEAFIQAIDNILAASTDIGVQWIRNGQPISGAISQFYEATQTGFYQFSVTVNGCTVLSDIYQLTTLGTNTNEFDYNSLKVFPNPFNDLLNIEVKEDSFQSFQIIDLQGRLIVQEKISGNSHQINLSSLPQSVYILEIITDKGKQRVKIIKK